MRGRSSPGDARTVPLYAAPSAAGAGLRTPGEGIRVLSGCFRGMGGGGRGVALRGVQFRGAGGRRMGKGERKWGGNWGREGINAELQGRIERGWSVGVGGAELFEAVLGGKDGVRVLRRVPGCLPRGGEVVLRQCPRSSVPAGNGFWTAAPSLPPSRCLLASSSPSPPLLPSPLSERHRAPFPLASAAKVCDGLQSTLTFISTPLRALAARTLREGTLPICYGTGPATPAPLAWAVGWVPRGEELRSVQLLFILPPSLLPPLPTFFLLSLSDALFRFLHWERP